MSKSPTHSSTQLLEATLAAVGMVGFALAFLWTATMLAHGATTSSLAVWVVLGAFVGYLGADLFSGVVHWAFDTWGRSDSLFLGDLFIRPFREHHSDPLAFTRRGFVIMNGYNALVCIPVLALGSWGMYANGPSAYASFLGAACLVGTAFVFFTNQFHAWAHVDDVPAFARLLQRARIILSREEHERHHTAPHLVGYCITSGWLNPVLERTKVFSALERVISLVTGARPRQDA